MIIGFPLRNSVIFGFGRCIAVGVTSSVQLNSVRQLSRFPPLQSMDTPHDPDFRPVEIAGFRKPYYNKDEPYFMESAASADPFIQFDVWFKDVCSHAGSISYEEMNACCVSTCVNNKPSSRMVLLKKYDKSGFTFFTNSISRKGREMTENPNIAMLFYWPFVNRQVRIEGKVERISEAETDEYWNSRPITSRIGGAISEQSQEVPSRQFLEAKRAELIERVAQEGPSAVPRPQSWSGFLLKPNYFEFWQGQSDRLHDRLAYRQNGEEWTRFRLSP
ncbi:Pyridoxal 5'-phosphate synthase [Aphelenchoides besseyi]|nr:Pyridoxal 5'-phosphate synthase [Aphelenchoides besseyi]KAI6209581.1 Pyridoxal 5'-phosphate synthase [Aphelenchoides besseyi]